MFSDRVIRAMDINALEFWKANKEWLLSVCASHKAKSEFGQRAAEIHPAEPKEGE